MRKKHLISLSTAVFSCIYMVSAMAASAIFSDYGQIQNVQKYSSNPFWTPNSPYNQRLPQPVYVQGADLNAGECENIVNSLINVQCSARNNCKSTSLKDIKPVILIQLSNLPGHNYLYACSGYIDYLYDSYVTKYRNTIPQNRVVAFPQATEPAQYNDNTNMVFEKNPFKADTPKWKQEIAERAQELKELQEQNSVGTEHLSSTAFPKTYKDISFQERVANETEGYKPFKDKHAYDLPQFKDEDEWCEDHSGSDICKKYTITYHLDGGVNNPNNPLIYKPRQTPIKLEDPTFENCEKKDANSDVFMGWFTEKEYTNKIETIEKGMNKNLKLFAKWNCKDFKIEYDIGSDARFQDPTQVPYSYKINTATNVKLPTETTNGKITRPLHAFEGWYTAANGGGDLVKEITKTDTGDKKFYAKWRKNGYKITYDVNCSGATHDSPTSYTTDADTQLKDASNCPNKDFDCWQEGNNCITKIPAGTTGDKTLKAKWKNTQQGGGGSGGTNYTITYKTDNANGCPQGCKCEIKSSFNKITSFDSSTRSVNLPTNDDITKTKNPSTSTAACDSYKCSWQESGNPVSSPLNVSVYNGNITLTLSCSVNMSI
ncbi:MAG: InlB B-repeat-containing protein [Alphaproteobacteria bacterium]|nr:InlB B-repeat-containing protein [Alphaproteobacteria bacterium]